MVLNLVSLAPRLQEPSHTAAVVRLPGASAGARPTTGLAGGGGVGADVGASVEVGGGGGGGGGRGGGGRGGFGGGGGWHAAVFHVRVSAVTT